MYKLKARSEQGLPSCSYGIFPSQQKLIYGDNLNPLFFNLFF